MIYLRLSKEFDMLFFLMDVPFMAFRVKCLALFCIFFVINGFEMIWMRSLSKNIQLMLVFLKDAVLVLHFLLLYINDLLYIIYVSMLMVLLYVLSGIWFEMASELKSDLRGTIDWGGGGAGSGLVISMLEKQLVLFYQANNSGANDVKMSGSDLRKNNLLRCWDCLSLLNWIGALTLSHLLKMPPRELRPWFVLWSFFSSKLFFVSLNLPYDLA